MKPFLMTDEKKERYLKAGYWGRPTLHEVFRKKAEELPDKEFLIDSTKRLTYSEAKKYVDRLALGMLDLGLKKDDVIVVQLPNIVEAALLRLAIPSAGILAAMVMVAFDEKEIKHILQKTEAKGIVIPWEFRNRNYFEMVSSLKKEVPSLQHVFVLGDEVPDGAISIKEMMEKSFDEELVNSYFEDKAISTWEVQELQTTTGSTGLPKISEGYGWYQLQGKAIGERLKATSDDIIGFVVPFIGGPGNCLWCVGINYGCTLIFQEKFVPDEALSLVEKERISILVGVPTVGEKLMRTEGLEKYDLSSLRVFFTAGAPMPPSLAKEIEEKMKCKVIGIIGSMDFGPIAMPSIDDPQEVRLFSLGKPLPGNEVRIIDENGKDVPAGEKGLLVCRGPYAYTGYYKMPEATLESYGGDKDGWFNMQDLAKVDEKGNLYIVGRLQDIIKRGAMTIAPVEIEDLLRTHDAVEDVAVVPMPDPVLGERVCVYVIPKKGMTVTLEDILSFLKNKGLAKFKLPERLEIIDNFPIKGDQKVDKRKLSEMVAEKLRAEGKI